MDEELESFYFKETIAGVEHDYRITMNECSYGIERDGVIIAELQHNETWVQISGEHLPASVIEKLGNKIEDHYE